MSRIKNRDTKPELIVRKALHYRGYRFRLYRKDLPGHPDIVLPKHKTVIFVHGCFWHRHEGCRYAYQPKSRIDFWQKKFHQNIDRDKTVRKLLVEAGWNVFIIWECETKKPELLEQAINKIFNSM